MKDYCRKCGIPREAYDLKIEPGISNPDYALGDCSHGHIWVDETVTIYEKYAELTGAE